MTKAQPGAMHRPSLARTARSAIRGSAGIAVAMGIMNVATYAFTILAAYLLGPRDFGAVAGLMGLLLIVNVLALGLQATGARQVAANPSSRNEIEKALLSTATRSSLVLGALCLAATPLIVWVLSLQSWMPALLIGLSALPLTLMGGQAGILQGERRWGALGALYLGMGLGRLLLGAVIMPLMPSATGAMLAVALGAWVPAVIGATALGRVGAMSATGSAFREVAGNAHALLIFFALSNLDVVLARAVLDEHSAGLYAGGVILTKAVLFLPQFVLVVAFPSMASHTTRRRTYLGALAVVAAIGMVATVVVAFLDTWAVSFIGGKEYSEVRTDLWLFALLGTVLALLQLMVYELVARQHRLSIAVLWVGLAGVVVAGVAATGWPELLRAVLAVDVFTLAALLGVLLRHDTRRRSRAPTQPA